jgi:pimeloyl-ACP methyl ester carboxylesterase
VTWLSTSEQLDHLRLAAEIADIEVDSIVLPEERELVVRGLTLHYLDWGTRGRPPILFLHGGGLTAHTWDLVCLTLRRNYRCLALDQRGHGESAWPPDGDYGTEAYVADIEALVEQLQLHQPVLVGQSLGGVNALTYAARHSDEMTALVVVDAGPQVRRGGAQRISDFISATAHLHSLEEFVERALAFNPRRDPRLLRQSLLHNLRRLPDGRFTRKSDPRLLAAFRANFTERLNRLDAVIDAITCPTLVLRGAQSDVFSDQDAERLAQRLRRGSWMRVEGAGHTIQGDHPRALSDAVEGYLGALGSIADPPSSRA